MGSITRNRRAPNEALLISAITVGSGYACRHPRMSICFHGGEVATDH